MTASPSVLQDYEMKEDNKGSDDVEVIDEGSETTYLLQPFLHNHHIGTMKDLPTWIVLN